MVSVEERTTGLNRLIRGELSAVETYRQVLDKMKDAPEAVELHALLVEHRAAVQMLREHVVQRGGTPANNSGAWGAWAKFTQGTANLFGDASALKSLKEGEEHGLKDYMEGADDIDATSEELVRNQLIPAQQRHINLLDQLIGTVGRSA